jgi:hypothetical protein
MTEFGLVSDFAQLICIGDEALKKIANSPLLINDAGFIMKLLDNDGNNAVIVRLELRNKHDIIFYADKLLERFDSVSWVHKERLFTRRRKT